MRPSGGVEGARAWRTFCLARALANVPLATILSAYGCLVVTSVPRKHLAKPPCHGIHGDGNSGKGNASKTHGETIDCWGGRTLPNNFPRAYWYVTSLPSASFLFSTMMSGMYSTTSFGASGGAIAAAVGPRDATAVAMVVGVAGARTDGWVGPVDGWTGRGRGSRRALLPARADSQGAPLNLTVGSGYSFSFFSPQRSSVGI